MAAPSGIEDVVDGTPDCGADRVGGVGWVVWRRKRREQLLSWRVGGCGEGGGGGLVLVVGNGLVSKWRRWRKLGNGVRLLKGWWWWTRGVGPCVRNSGAFRHAKGTLGLGCFLNSCGCLVQRIVWRKISFHHQIHQVLILLGLCVISHVYDK